MHESGMVTGRNQAPQSDETKTSPSRRLPPKSSDSKQESSYTFCPVVAARCLFQSMSSDNLVPASLGPNPSVNLKPSWFSSEAKAPVLQLPQLLQGGFACEFQQDFRA